MPHYVIPAVMSHSSFNSSLFIKMWSISDTDESMNLVGMEMVALKDCSRVKEIINIIIYV